VFLISCCIFYHSTMLCNHAGFPALLQSAFSNCNKILFSNRKIVFSPPLPTCSWQFMRVAHRVFPTFPPLSPHFRYFFLPPFFQLSLAYSQHDLRGFRVERKNRVQLGRVWGQKRQLTLHLSLGPLEELSVRVHSIRNVLNI